MEQLREDIESVRRARENALKREIAEKYGAIKTRMEAGEREATWRARRLELKEKLVDAVLAQQDESGSLPVEESLKETPRIEVLPFEVTEPALVPFVPETSVEEPELDDVDEPNENMPSVLNVINPVPPVVRGELERRANKAKVMSTDLANLLSYDSEEARFRRPSRLAKAISPVDCDQASGQSLVPLTRSLSAERKANKAKVMATELGIEYGQPVRELPKLSAKVGGEKGDEMVKRKIVKDSEFGLPEVVRRLPADGSGASAEDRLANRRKVMSSDLTEHLSIPVRPTRSQSVEVISVEQQREKKEASEVVPVPEPTGVEEHKRWRWEVDHRRLADFGMRYDEEPIVFGDLEEMSIGLFPSVQGLIWSIRNLPHSMEEEG